MTRLAVRVIATLSFALVTATALAGALPRRPALGVSLAPVPEEQARQAGLASGEAALIAGLSPGLTAEQAGVRTGDILIKLDGRPISVGTVAGDGAADAGWQGRRPAGVARRSNH